MTDPSIVYATDEDVAIRASADFALLCPRDQCLAYGADGVFAGDAWTLQSPSADFLALGVAPGQVVRLTLPTTYFKPPGEALVVDTVGAGQVRLRRKGLPSGVGRPPGPPSDVANVEFTVTTLGPQIAAVSYDLDRRFGIDGPAGGHRPTDLLDPRELRDATVLTVLSRQYLELSRGGQDGVDTFVAKSQAYKQELDDLLARLVLHWKGVADGMIPEPATARPSTRLSR